MRILAHFADLCRSLLARLRSLGRGLFSRRDVESEIREEFAHHIELRTEDLMRDGMSPVKARRRAHLEFGHMEAHREDARSSRGLAFFDHIRFSWLDFKLAFRMLVRYPGLTVVSVLAMTAGIAVGTGFLEFSSQWADPDLPFDPDDRMVGIMVDDAETSRSEGRLLHDFASWRDELRSVEELGAIHLRQQNLGTDDGRSGDAGQARPVQVTEISASAFRMTRTPALVGRTLVEADERPGAPPVVVLGHDLWQDRFGGDPGVVGRTVRLGDASPTVVGIMPEGYAFPRSQNLWTPFRLRPLDLPVGESPGIYIFGRLAPGASIEQAQAEIATRELRIAGARPDDGARLSARVVPYPELVFMPIPGFFDPAFIFVNLFILALVLLFCANVALLLFARAASRESEMRVRSALGAGRSRIVIQLFSEALVLGAIAAVLGLVGARYGYEWFLMVLEEGEGSGFLPFWHTPSISPLTMAYTVGLTLLGAGVAGVLPALKVTKGIAHGLRSQSAGGGGLSFGGVWTVIIVAQIAVTVPLPAFAYLAVDELVTVRTPTVGFVTEQYLTARLSVDREMEPGAQESPGFTEAEDPARTGAEDPAFVARYASTLGELERRLRAEPAVVGVTYSSRLPLSYHPWHRVELDGPMAEAPTERGHLVGAAEVEPGFSETMEGEVLAGRALDSEDVLSGAPVVVVDRTFADRILGGRDPVGLRLRYVASEGSPVPDPNAPWHEIVGMVEDLGISRESGGVYHPAARGSVFPASILVRLRGDPGEFAPRLRSMAAAIGPTLLVEELRPLSDVSRDEVGLYAWGASAVIVLSLAALMLSLSGIYSVMSFTVARRTREIGIRVALGADPRRLVAAIFRRPLLQVVLGVVLGALLLVQSLELLTGFQRFATQQYILMAIHSLVMFGVCMLACAVPTRRALAVEPAEALNVEG